MHKRSDPNGPWHVEGQARTPLLLPRVEGQILSFEVEHHKCHGCPELGPNVKFRMELTGPNEARLWNLEDGHAGKDLAPGTTLLRRTDSVAALLVPPSAPTTPANASFAGTWQGKMNDIAGIDLTINEAVGNLSGVALLYFQVGSAQPLRSPHVEGKALAFEVERRTCNQCEDLVSKYRMELTGPNEARLWMLDDLEPNKRSGPKVKMVRRTDSPSWYDASQHKVHFVIVEYGVRLEVLDWGGTGQPVVLLAGSGNTAHIFDDFAPKLASFCHVYGITRRGYGTSSHPDSGYTEQRLAEDVLQVLNSLEIVAPVLVGHSMAGEELTRLGDEHSDRLAGLVYLDAAGDPTDWPASSPAYMALYLRLMAAKRGRPSPSPAPPLDRSSFRAYRDSQMRRDGFAFPESELRNQYETMPDGSVGPYKASTPAIHNAIGVGALKRDYSRIGVPILAFFPASCSQDPPKNYACIDHPSGRKPEDPPKDAEERAAKEAFDAATATYVKRWRGNLLEAAAGVRFVDLPGANHNLFHSNEADVLREMRTFLAGLN